MANYMALITINPTTDLLARAAVASYYLHIDKEAAERLVTKNRYKPIKMRVPYIYAAALEAKRRYFSNYKFLEIS